MSQIVEAVFDGKVFRPVNALELPSDTHYRLIVEPMPSPEPSDIWTMLASAAGSVEAPPDWSTQHDHYLYGTARQQKSEP